MAFDKIKPENLVASSRCPVIPDIPKSEKVKVEQEAREKAKERAERAKRTVENRKAAETPLPEQKKEPDDMSVASIREPMVEKTKPKKPGVEIPASKETTFPVEAFVNEYGFIKVQKKILEKIGWLQKIDARRCKKVLVTLDFVDDALILKKMA